MANHVSVTAELQGTIVGLFVEVGAVVSAGEVLALVESMKMHHEVTSPSTGVIDAVLVVTGDTVHAGQSLMELHEIDVGAAVVQPDAVPAGVVGLERDDLPRRASPRGDRASARPQPSDGSREPR
jgi:pyruvate/2-oxoglutarate dehydrogenase complex dihydrolipoamide acyltransferase (E2) component